jgi:hypothetical protein
MRMKKLIILAAAAIAAVACSRTFDTAPAKEQAIGFGTWTDQLTKARTAGSSTFGAGDSFTVEGFKTLSGSPVTVFNDVTVSTTDGMNWTYENTRFWDKNATGYTFFAVSSPNTALAFAADGTIAATDVTFSGNGNDILLADQVDVAPAAFTNTPVALNFKHIGSLVDLKVKKSAGLKTAGATVAITAIALEKIDGAGKVAVTGYTTNVPTVAWTELDGNTTYTNTSGVTSVATLPTNVGTTGDNLINTLVVIPQTLTDTKILKISYTITDAATNLNTYNNIVIKLNQFDKDDDTENGPSDFISSWEAGKHYIYTLTIDANTINFSGTITDWTTVNGYNYLLN